MAETDPRKLAELNALGLPRSEEGIGSTMRPDLNVEREGREDVDKKRREVERDVYERRTFTDRAAEAHWDEQRPAPIASDAAAGDPTSAGVSGGNEQQGARLAHAKGQSDEPAAPDQTRAQGRQGSINETEGH